MREQVLHINTFSFDPIHLYLNSLVVCPLEPAALDRESRLSSLKYQNPVFLVRVRSMLSAAGLTLFHSFAGEYEQLKSPLLIFIFIFF